MLHSTIVRLLLAALAATACGDSPEPTFSIHRVPPTQPPSPFTPADAIYLDPERSALVGDTMWLRGYVRRDGERGPDTLIWEVQSPDIASIEVVEKDRIRLHTLRTGRTTVIAHTTGSRAPLSATLRVNVLARSAEPSPIVADEFRIIEFRSPFIGGGWGYAPQLTLRDTTGRASSRVVALTVEFPDVGPPVRCWADRVLGTTPWTVFAAVGSMDGLSVFRDHAVDPAAKAVARVTVRLADTLGVLLTARGTLAPGAWEPGWPDAVGEVAACE